MHKIGPRLDSMAVIPYNKTRGVWFCMNKKNAMTLAEVLFVFIIIGIIATIAIVTVKPWDKACKYSYSRMYHSIRLAFYNAMLTQAEFPTTSTKFCNLLTEYINTSTDGANCSKSRDLTNNPRIFPDEKIQIQTSSAVKMWIGANNEQPFVHTETESSGVTSKTKYYLVYVDLNGNKGPNTAKWQEDRLSDIVAFAVTDTLAVIPLGHPEVDNRYLYAHVIYPQVDESEPDGNISDDMTYYEAKKKAWGNNVDSADTMSLNISKDLPNDSYFKLTNTGNVNSPYYPDGDSYTDFFPMPIGPDTANGCREVSTPCYVDIFEYH